MLYIVNTTFQKTVYTFEKASFRKFRMIFKNALFRELFRNLRKVPKAPGGSTRARYLTIMIIIIIYNYNNYLLLLLLLLFVIIIIIIIIIIIQWLKSAHGNKAPPLQLFSTSLPMINNHHIVEIKTIIHHICEMLILSNQLEIQGLEVFMLECIIAKYTPQKHTVANFIYLKIMQGKMNIMYSFNFSRQSPDGLY